MSDDSDIGDDIEDVPIPPPSYRLDDVSDRASSPNQEDSSSAPSSYRLCGDNVDKSIKHRYMRSATSGSVSDIHYLHSYAVKNRISTHGLSEASPATPTADAKQLALSLLPSADDDSTISKNFVALVSRVLVDQLPFFEHTFDHVVAWHTPHSFSEQMKAKSDVVGLWYLISLLVIG